MGQLVDEDEITRTNHRRDDAEISEIARTEDARRLGALQPREPRFKLAQQGMIAGHEAGGTGADPVNPQCLDGGVLDRRVMGEVEVVIAGERQQPTTLALQPNSRHAGGIDERTA